MMHLLNLDDICTDPELLDLDAFNAKNEGFVIAKQSDTVKQKIQNALAEHSATELEARLNEVGVPAAKVRSLSEFLDEIIEGANMTIPFMTFKQPNKTIKTAGLGFTLDNGIQLTTNATPSLGEHTYDLLKSIGISEDQITKMLAANVLR
jgi:crotonobetainyl-CoA:carnitine CoA-transferase CaiB-like acyl-CoA transferase